MGVFLFFYSSFEVSPFFFFFFLLHFHGKCNANRVAKVTELFHNHHKIQVLVLVETGTARYIYAFGYIYQTSKIIHLMSKAKTQVCMHILQKLSL